jgi:hypothetical protein
MNPSPTQYPLEDAYADGRCLRVALRYTLSLLMPALLPRGDESAMISERVGVLFRPFLETFFELGVTFAENVTAPPVGEPNRMEPVLWARQTRERDTYRRYYPSQANLKGAFLGQARLPGADLSQGEENTEERPK